MKKKIYYFRVFLTAFVVLSFNKVSAQPGMPDTSFGNNNGYLVSAGVNGAPVMNDFRILPDGSFIASGETNFNQNNTRGLVIKYNSAGIPDVNFGINGEVSHNMASYYKDIGIQSNGKIIAVGRGRNSATPSSVGMLVQRYNANGTVDYTFGNGTGNNVNLVFFEAKAVVIQPDDKILLCGTRTDNISLGLTRLNANGTYDTTFNHNVQVDFSSSSYFYDILEMRQGTNSKIYILGRRVFNSELVGFVAAFNSNGWLDTTFGANGIIETVNEFANITLDSDNNVYLTGSYYDDNQSNTIVAKYLSDGTPDASFGAAGLWTPQFSFASRGGDLAFDLNENIILGVNLDVPPFTSGPFDYALAKYDTNGIQDMSFGQADGLTTFQITPYANYSRDLHTIRIQSDNKIVVGSKSHTFVLARYNSDPIVLNTDGFNFKTATAYVGPNPTNGTLKVYNAGENYTIAIFDPLGRKLAGKTDLTDSPAGLYHIQLTTSAGTSVSKIIKE